jgi:arylformamidase
MKIYDITQELFSGQVYPGDPVPTYDRVFNMAEGALYNLTSLKMGAHNATHLDAPFHFYENGKTIEQLELSRCIGSCSVIDITGEEEEEELIKLLEACQKRILIKGNKEVTLTLAKLINQCGIVLVGVESQSVGPIDSPMQVHLELLREEVVLLEGVVLKDILVGDYFLFAAPLKLGGIEGAPCRAVLLKFE